MCSQHSAAFSPVQVHKSLYNDGEELDVGPHVRLLLGSAQDRAEADSQVARLHLVEAGVLGDLTEVSANTTSHDPARWQGSTKVRVSVATCGAVDGEWMGSGVELGEGLPVCGRESVDNSPHGFSSWVNCIGLGDFHKGIKASKGQHGLCKEHEELLHKTLWGCKGERGVKGESNSTTRDVRTVNEYWHHHDDDDTTEAATHSNGGTITAIKHWRAAGLAPLSQQSINLA